MRTLLILCLLLAACTSAADTTTGSIESSPATSADGGSGETTSPSDGELVCWDSPQPGTAGEVDLEEVTAKVGLVEPLTGMHGHAAAWGDVNDDGYPDLFVGTFGDRPAENYAERGAEGPRPDQLLVSKPELTAEADFSDELARTSGSLFADLDGDGDLDLVAVRHAGVGGNADAVSRIYMNTDGTLTAAAEILPSGFRGRTPTTADFDGDGLLDLYVAEDRYGDTGGLLLINDGDMSFVDMTADSGLDGVFSLGAMAADIDGDGTPDLVLSNGVFTNDGSGRFTDVTPEGYVAEPLGNEDDPAGVAVGDLNRDGLPEIVVGQHFRSTVEFDAEVPVRVFLNETDGGVVAFRDVTEASGINSLPTLAPHVHIADLNNDGWPDILASASADGGSVPVIYVNEGGSELSFTSAGNTESDHYWVGAPVADLNRDGLLDVLAVEWEPSIPSLYFENTSESGHWLEVSVAGPGRGVGAVVTVEGTDGSLLGRQEIGVATGYSSAHEGVAHFGLGAAESVVVRLHLPSGEQVDLGTVGVDRHLRWPAGCS